MIAAAAAVAVDADAAYVTYVGQLRCAAGTDTSACRRLKVFLVLTPRNSAELGHSRGGLWLAIRPTVDVAISLNSGTREQAPSVGFDVEL